MGVEELIEYGYEPFGNEPNPRFFKNKQHGFVCEVSNNDGYCFLWPEPQEPSKGMVYTIDELKSKELEYFRHKEENLKKLLEENK